MCYSGSVYCACCGRKYDDGNVGGCGCTSNKCDDCLAHGCPFSTSKDKAFRSIISCDGKISASA